MELVFRAHVIGDIPDEQKLHLQRMIYQQLIRSARHLAKDTYKLMIQEDPKLSDLVLDSTHEVVIRERDDTLDDGVAGYVDNHVLIVHRK